MQWCPVTREDCKIDCVLFAEGQCAFARLHDVVDQLEEVRNSIDDLEQTIKNKSFSE